MTVTEQPTEPPTGALTELPTEPPPGALTELPMEPQALETCAPVYEEFDGWQQSTVGITEYDALPEKAKTYLNHLSDLLETDIALISTGPKREQTIMTPQCDSLLKFGVC